MKTITLYTKPDCLLCHKAERELRELQREIPFELICKDITEDPELFERYRYDIPVVMLDGVELCRHRLDREKLYRMLKHPAQQGC